MLALHWKPFFLQFPFPERTFWQSLNSLVLFSAGICEWEASRLPWTCEVCYAGVVASKRQQPFRAGPAHPGPQSSEKCLPGQCIGCHPSLAQWGIEGDSWPKMADLDFEIFPWCVVQMCQGPRTANSWVIWCWDSLRGHGHPHTHHTVCLGCTQVPGIAEKLAVLRNWKTWKASVW